MDSIKKYAIGALITILLVIISSFLINVLNYFDILNNGVYKGFLILFSVLSVAAGSYFLGNNSSNKGYLKGAIFGIVIITIFILLSFIFSHKLSNSSIIYYLTLLVTSSIAGMIGINKKNTGNISQ